MLTYTNSAKFRFVWPELSNIVEVYHPSASYNEAPLEAVMVADLPHSREGLKTLASAIEYKAF